MGLLEVPGDRLVISTHYDGKFVVFDLNEMAFIKTIDFPGESYIWAIAMGSDGRVYGGTYPNSKIAALNLDTYEVTEAAKSPKHNMYSSVSATVDGRIVCNFSRNNSMTMLYDPAKGAVEPMPPDLRDGVLWKGFFLCGAEVYDGLSDRRIDPPPFPTPPADKGAWLAHKQLTTDEYLFLQQGDIIYRYREGDGQLTLVADNNLDRMQLYGSSRDRRVLGVRGQDYVVLTAGVEQPRMRPIPVETGPRHPAAEDRYAPPTLGRPHLRPDALPDGCPHGRVRQHQRRLRRGWRGL